MELRDSERTSEESDALAARRRAGGAGRSDSVPPAAGPPRAHETHRKAERAGERPPCTHSASTAAARYCCSPRARARIERAVWNKSFGTGNASGRKVSLSRNAACSATNSLKRLREVNVLSEPARVSITKTMCLLGAPTTCLPTMRTSYSPRPSGAFRVRAAGGLGPQPCVPNERRDGSTGSGAEFIARSAPAAPPAAPMALWGDGASAPSATRTARKREAPYRRGSPEAIACGFGRRGPRRGPGRRAVITRARLVLPPTNESKTSCASFRSSPRLLSGRQPVTRRARPTGSDGRAQEGAADPCRAASSVRAAAAHAAQAHVRSAVRMCSREFFFLSMHG